MLASIPNRHGALRSTASRCGAAPEKSLFPPSGQSDLICGDKMDELNSVTHDQTRPYRYLKTSKTKHFAYFTRTMADA